MNNFILFYINKKLKKAKLNQNMEGCTNNFLLKANM